MIRSFILVADGYRISFAAQGCQARLLSRWLWLREAKPELAEFEQPVVTAFRMFRLSHDGQAGIPIFVTGGIGGVHRGADVTWDAGQTDSWKMWLSIEVW